MRTYSELMKLLTKYALLLAIVYAIEVISRYVFYTFFKPENGAGLNTLNGQLFFVLGIIGNLVVMLFVMKDKRRFMIKNRFLEILTFFYRPLGVCILLIQVILETKKEEVELEILDVE